MTAAKKLDPNKVKTRDYLLVRLICGATKAGPAKNQKKDQNRKACRKPVRREDA